MTIAIYVFLGMFLLLMVWVVLSRMRVGGSSHPQFTPLDVSQRTELTPDAFYQKFYAAHGVDKSAVLRVLAHVSERSGIAGGLLEPTDKLGEIAAANGFNRAMFVADLMTTFPEAQAEIGGKMMAGEFTILHHAIAVVAMQAHPAGTS